LREYRAGGEHRNRCNNCFSNVHSLPYKSVLAADKFFSIPP